MDEYANLDAQDESLARWKASLGVIPGASSGATSGPKVSTICGSEFDRILTGRRPQVTVLTLFLTSPTLPAGRRIDVNVQDQASLERLKKDPIVIKEGVEYKCVNGSPAMICADRWRDFSVGITFKVNHSIISGVRYIQIVKRSGIKGTD